MAILVLEPGTIATLQLSLIDDLTPANNPVTGESIAAYGAVVLGCFMVGQLTWEER